MSKFTTHLASEYVAKCQGTVAEEGTKTLNAKVAFGNELMVRARGMADAALPKCNPKILQLYDQVVLVMKGLSLDERLFVLANLEAGMTFDAVGHVKDIQIQVAKEELERKLQMELSRKGLVTSPVNGFGGGGGSTSRVASTRSSPVKFLEEYPARSAVLALEDSSDL